MDVQQRNNQGIANANNPQKLTFAHFEGHSVQKGICDHCGKHSFSGTIAYAKNIFKRACYSKTRLIFKDVYAYLANPSKSLQSKQELVNDICDQIKKGEVSEKDKRDWFMGLIRVVQDKGVDKELREQLIFAITNEKSIQAPALVKGALEMIKQGDLDRDEYITHLLGKFENKMNSSGLPSKEGIQFLLKLEEYINNLEPSDVSCENRMQLSTCLVRLRNNGLGGRLLGSKDLYKKVDQAAYDLLYTVVKDSDFPTGFRLRSLHKISSDSFKKQNGPSFTVLLDAILDDCKKDKRIDFVEDWIRHIELKGGGLKGPEARMQTLRLLDEIEEEDPDFCQNYRDSIKKHTSTPGFLEAKVQHHMSGANDKSRSLLDRMVSEIELIDSYEELDPSENDFDETIRNHFREKPVLKEVKAFLENKSNSLADRVALLRCLEWGDCSGGSGMPAIVDGLAKELLSEFGKDGCMELYEDLRGTGFNTSIPAQLVLDICRDNIENLKEMFLLGLQKDSGDFHYVMLDTILRAIVESHGEDSASEAALEFFTNQENFDRDDLDECRETFFPFLRGKEAVSVALLLVTDETVSADKRMNILFSSLFPGLGDIVFLNDEISKGVLDIFSGVMEGAKGKTLDAIALEFYMHLAEDPSLLELDERLDIEGLFTRLFERFDKNSLDGDILKFAEEKPVFSSVLSRVSDSNISPEDRYQKMLSLHGSIAPDQWRSACASFIKGLSSQDFNSIVSFMQDVDHPMNLFLIFEDADIGQGEVYEPILQTFVKALFVSGLLDEKGCLKQLSLGDQANFLEVLNRVIKGDKAFVDTHVKPLMELMEAYDDFGRSSSARYLFTDIKADFYRLMLQHGSASMTDRLKFEKNLIAILQDQVFCSNTPNLDVYLEVASDRPALKSAIKIAKDGDASFDARFEALYAVQSMLDKAEWQDLAQSFIPVALKNTGRFSEEQLLALCASDYESLEALAKTGAVQIHLVLEEVAESHMPKLEGLARSLASDVSLPVWQRVQAIELQADNEMSRWSSIRALRMIPMPLLRSVVMRF